MISNFEDKKKQLESNCQSYFMKPICISYTELCIELIRFDSIRFHFNIVCVKNYTARNHMFFFTWNAIKNRDKKEHVKVTQTPIICNQGHHNINNNFSC